MLARLLAVVTALVLPLAWPPAASADGPGAATTPDLRMAQTIAGVELTVVIRRAATVPGPLGIDLVAYAPVRAVTIEVRLGPRTTTVHLTHAGSYPITLDVAGTGPRQLVLRAGDEVSVLPFRVLVPRAAWWQRLVYGGFALAAVLLAAALVFATRASRALAVLLGTGTMVTLVVALTVALLSAWLPPSTSDGAASPSGVRPYAQGRFTTTPVAPVAGVPFTLALDLVDGSTGRPVDDLAVTHAALAHVAVSSTDGEFFRHVHPLRTGPGRLAVTLTADRPGRYLVSAELARTGSGGQLLTGGFTVDGTPAPTPRPLTAEKVVLEPSQAVAGRPVTIEVDTGDAKLQPWLEMAGHLIVRGQDGGFFGHVHELGSMTSGMTPVPDETVAAYGPVLRFTFDFPAPGRYLAWVQYARDFRIMTVPFTVEVG